MGVGPGINVPDYLFTDNRPESEGTRSCVKWSSIVFE
jgi:hypothetical protein